MRASDLLRTTVVDEAGTRLGEIRDLVVVEDGPLGAGARARMRVERLIVGHGSLAHRLGYVHGGVRGPWLVRLLFARHRRRGGQVSWTDVVHYDVDGRTLTVRTGASRPHPPAP